jgi:hypothetical protein
MKVLFKWYEPVEYGRRITATPVLDRALPLVVGALVGVLVAGSVAKESGEIQGRHVLLFLTAFALAWLLLSWFFPFSFRAEIWMAEDGLRRVVGRAGRGQFFPYDQIERCSFSPGDEERSYTLMNIRMKGGYENMRPGPLYRTAVPAKVDLERVKGILRGAEVPVDN